MGMTKEEAQIVIGNIPIKPEILDDCYDITEYQEAKAMAIEALEQQPRQGHWIKVTNGRGGHECDACHDYAPSFQNRDEYLSAFCPNCGADMRESEEAE